MCGGMQVAHYLKQSRLCCVMHVIMPVYLLLRLKTAVEKENEMTPTRLKIKRLHQLTTKNKLYRHKGTDIQKSAKFAGFLLQVVSRNK